MSRYIHVHLHEDADVDVYGDIHASMYPQVRCVCVLLCLSVYTDLHMHPFPMFNTCFPPRRLLIDWFWWLWSYLFWRARHKSDRLKVQTSR